MQKCFTVYDGLTEINLLTANPFCTIKTLSSLNRHIFIINERDELYGGYVEIGATNVELVLLQSHIVDVQCSSSDGCLYTIDVSGDIHHMAISRENCQNPTPVWSKLIVPNPRVCPHGLRSTSESVRMAAVHSNCDGVLFTSAAGELFGMGNFGEVLRSSSPVPVECLHGFQMIQVTTGDHFVVVLTHQKKTSTSDTNSSSSDCSEEVFMNAACTECVPIVSLTNRVERSSINIGNNTETPVACSSHSLMNESDARPRSENITNINLMLKTLSFEEDPSIQEDNLEHNEITEDQSTDRGFPPNLFGDSDDSFTGGGPIGQPNNSRTAESRTEAIYAKISRIGATALATSVWSFGTVNKGHLGTGDHIRRTRINEVLGLTGQGVIGIASGNEHSAAVTLDGRLYLWGSNGEHQINSKDVEDVAAPIRYSHAQNVWSAVCGRSSTGILLNSFDLREIRHNTSGTVRTFNSTVTEPLVVPTHILLASNEFLVQNHCPLPRGFLEKHLSFEQQQLRDTLYTYLTQIKPSLKKLNFTSHNTSLIEDLCQAYLSLVHLSAATVRSLRAIFRTQCTQCADILLLVNSHEIIVAYQVYTKRLANVFAQPGGFRGLDPFHEEVFVAPLQLVRKRLELIGSVREAEPTANYQSCFADRHSAWTRFKKEMEHELKQAQNTCEFWETVGKSLTGRVYTVDRRLVLNSNNAPLKWQTGGRFTTHHWMLFNDAFCRVSGVGKELHLYPLVTVWIVWESSNSFRLITPEEAFLLSESPISKGRWYTAISSRILRCLHRTPTVQSPLIRNVSYTFSDRHPKYAKAKYTGQWVEGRMHGTGHLRYPDGREFSGQFVSGEISGYGRLSTPALGTTYAGNFVAGLYHGFGVLDMKDKGSTYEGHFRDGLFAGHGVLQTERFTYIGEFVKGVTGGYGVLDDAIGGDKYMGMFVDGRRSGFGVTITMEGNYFEGMFLADSLAGEGAGVFENGSYYEGELTLFGPNGKGTMFLPSAEVKNELVALDDQSIEMEGHVLSGDLSGEWNDIRVNHGNVTTNQSFPKIPRSLGRFGTDYNAKWQSLFSDWEYDVFGGNSASMSLVQLWQKFTMYQSNVERREHIHNTDGLNSSIDDLASLHSMQSNHQQTDTMSVDRMLMTSAYSPRPSSLGKTRSFHGTTYRSVDASAAHDYASLSPHAPASKLTANIRDVAGKMLNEQVQQNGWVDPKKGGRRDCVPRFAVQTMARSDLDELKAYLFESFCLDDHPFGALNARVSFCFYMSYGCWKVKPSPILCAQAMREWETISQKIYGWVRRMFPALPVDVGDVDGELLSHRSLLNPILLSDRVYSTMFVLYANMCSHRDELYRQRVLVCDRKTDDELAAFLKIEKSLMQLIQSSPFHRAIECLKQVKEKNCPREMLDQIEDTFRLIDEAKNESIGTMQHALSADSIMPLTIFLILRAGIPHLGAEIQLLEDLMGSDFETIMTGFAGYCFITIKATYQHILSSKFFQD